MNISDSANPLSPIDLTSSLPPTTSSASTTQRDAEKPHIYGPMARKSFVMARIDGNVTTVNIVTPYVVHQLQISEITSKSSTVSLINQSVRKSICGWKSMIWLVTTDSGNQGQIFEYSASNIRAHFVKPKPDFLNIRQTRIEVLGGEYLIFPSLRPPSPLM